MKTFWGEMKNLIGKIILKQITLDSRLFALSLYLDEHKISEAEGTFIDFSSLTAKGCIA